MAEYDEKVPKPTCYRCARHATSKEHVPPKSLFPEAAEHGGTDYRRNLITVPSCDAHNSAKSTDDEFLLMSLAGIIGSNSVGNMHRFGKVDRAISASNGHLLEAVLLEKRHVQKIKTENKFLEVVWGAPDVARLTQCFEHIAFGLHRYHFKKTFEGSVNVLLGYLVEHEHNRRKFVEYIGNLAERDLKDKPRCGSNPDVFYYQVSDADQFGLYMMRLCFYEGLPVYVAFTPTTSRPPINFSGLLIQRGIRTVITAGNKIYEFNPGN